MDLSTFLPAGLIDSEALGIDANGDIVGFADTGPPDFFGHAFLWEPVATVPEPASPLLLGSLLAGVVGLAWKRNWM